VPGYPPPTGQTNRRRQLAAQSADAEGDAVIIAAHVADRSVIWSDSRHVWLGSMEAEDAVNNLVAGLRDHTTEALTAYLAAYKRVK
jgi:hypothetical protein